MSFKQTLKLCEPFSLSEQPDCIRTELCNVLIVCSAGSVSLQINAHFQRSGDDSCEYVIRSGGPRVSEDD